MNIELNNEEKRQILLNLVKNYETTKFFVQSELDAELSIENTNPNVADSYSQQLLDLSKKIEYVNTQIELLNNE